MVSHMVDLSYVVDDGSPRKNMKNRQVGPLKCEEDPQKVLVGPKSYERVKLSCRVCLVTLVVYK